ncbi:hypothetical protein BCS42_05300 [Crenothrix sp. D3]|nr:hypothetical protein BCS42_05300 [Crenothrix sp. D3]
MNKKKNSLRAAAEEQLQPASTTNSETRSAEELLHELQVHQIELEMQNENLRQSYEALAESQQDYFDLYEFAPVGYLTLSQQGLIEKINLTGATLLGKSRSQLLQRRFAGFINATDTTRWHLFFAQVMRGNQQKTLEVSLKQPNDNWLHAQLHCLPVSKVNKQLTLRIVLTDITASKQAAERVIAANRELAFQNTEKENRAAELVIANKELLIAKNQLQAIINLMPIVVFVKDAQYRIILMNKACEKKWGLSFNQVKNTTGSQFFPPEQMADFLAVDKQAFTDDKPHETEGFVWNSQLQANRIHHSYKQAVFDESGQPLYLIGVSEDITERKQAEQQLRNNEAFTHSILNSLSAQIAVLDANGTIVTVNEAWRQFSDANGLPNSYNYNLNRSYFEQGSPSFQESQFKDAINIKCGISAVLAGTQQSFELEYPCHSPTEQRWFNMRVVPLNSVEQGVVVSHENITENKLAEIELRIAAAMFESDEMMMVTDANSVILKVNQKFSEVTGYSAVEVIGQTPRLLSSGQHDASFYAELWQGIHTTGQWKGEIWNRRKNGEIYPEWITITALKGNDKEVSHYVATMTDITERKRLEKSIHDSESKFRTLFDLSSDAIMLWDTLFFDCNPAALTLFGCKTVAEFCTYHPADLSPLEQPCGTSSLILEQQYIATALKIGSFRFEWTYKRIDTGEIFVAEVLLSALIVNEKPVLQATARDITERKAAEDKIQQLAFFDPLTGLPNRRKLHDRLQYAIAINRRNHNQFAVFMMDLDKFKAVNDKLGHAAGDELLKQVAARIKSCLRESDMVARLGGDEFVLVLENLKIPEMAEIIALKVIASLTLPFQLSENNSVQIGASIGISIYPQDGNTSESLMDHADTALYQAKDNGRGCFAYFSGNGLTLL